MCFLAQTTQSGTTDPPPTTASTSIEYTTPTSLQYTTSNPVQYTSTTSTSVQSTTSTSVQTTKSTSVQSTTSTPVQSSTSTSVQNTTSTSVQFTVTSESATMTSNVDIDTTEETANFAVPSAQTTIQYNCMCPCSSISSKWSFLVGANYTLDEIKDILKDDLAQLTKELSVDTESLSATINKRISAPDSRPSSQSIGCVGIIFIVIPFAFIFIIDFTRFFKR